jgi:luciferase family oxidoreductase group 1
VKELHNMDFGLSVLDVSPVSSGSNGAQALRETPELARLADRLGYQRYWLAEHHNLPSIASSAPEIMIGHVANVTERIRVGAGGIMLPNHAPLKVAETFRVLEALHPKRIDLGIGRAPGTDPVTATALRRSPDVLEAEDFPQRFGELLAFSGEGFPEDHPFRSVVAMPADVGLPPIWLLGSSGYSARAAGQMGLGYAFASHFSPADPGPAMRAYRESFEPSEDFERPSAILAVAVICGETDEHAERLGSSMELAWVRMRSGNPGPLPSPEEAMAYPLHRPNAGWPMPTARCKSPGILVPCRQESRSSPSAQRPTRSWSPPTSTTTPSGYAPTSDSPRSSGWRCPANKPPTTDIYAKGE